MMKIQELPKFDIPDNFIVGTGITASLLNAYGKFPCRIKAAVFVYCKKANIRANINLVEHTIKDHDFITLTPETFIQVHEIIGEVEIYFALFSSSFMLDNLFSKNNFEFFPVLIEHPVLSLSNEYAGIVEEYFNFLIKMELTEKRLFTDRRISRTYTLFMEEIAELYKDHHTWKHYESNRTNQIHKEFIQLLLLHYNKEHSVGFYAKELGLTLQHFCSTIKKASGRTALETISHVLIMDAKAQLKTTNLPVKEIGLALGFTNHGFFNKFFKQHVGITPQEYRNS